MTLLNNFPYLKASSDIVHTITEVLHETQPSDRNTKLERCTFLDSNFLRGYHVGNYCEALRVPNGIPKYSLIRRVTKTKHQTGALLYFYMSRQNLKQQ